MGLILNGEERVLYTTKLATESSRGAMAVVLLEDHEAAMAELQARIDKVVAMLTQAPKVWDEANIAVDPQIVVNTHVLDKMPGRKLVLHPDDLGLSVARTVAVDADCLYVREVRKCSQCQGNGKLPYQKPLERCDYCLGSGLVGV